MSSEISTLPSDFIPSLCDLIDGICGARLLLIYHVRIVKTDKRIRPFGLIISYSFSQQDKPYSKVLRLVMHYECST